MRPILLLVAVTAAAMASAKRHAPPTKHHVIRPIAPSVPAPTMAPVVGATDAPWPLALREYIAAIYYAKSQYDYQAAETAGSEAEAANALSNAKADKAYAASLLADE